MTNQPAILGGTAAFPDGLPLVRPTIPNIPALTQKLGSILESGMLTNASTVRALETEVKERLGVEHVVAVSNCTAGLMLTYKALGVAGPVIMPTFTFSASAHAVKWAGGHPVWADVSREHMTLDPADVEYLMDTQDAPAAISATHVYGRPAEVEALQAIADRAGIPLVFDSAHALGSYRGSVACGNFGTAEVFSMSPTKVAVAGEGGLVATNDAELARLVRIGRDYGNPGNYDCEYTGVNARMSELHAAVALASLDGHQERISYRNEMVEHLKKHLADTPGISYQHVADGDVSTYKDLTLVVEPDVFGMDAPTLQKALRTEGIDSRQYYVPAIHQQRAYADVPLTRELPNTEWLLSRVITPPLYSHMTMDQVTTLAGTIASLHRNAAAVVAALDA